MCGCKTRRKWMRGSHRPVGGAPQEGQRTEPRDSTVVHVTAAGQDQRLSLASVPLDCAKRDVTLHLSLCADPRFSRTSSPPLPVRDGYQAAR